jgi:4-hydroxybenzoate polyprenyltransferase
MIWTQSDVISDLKIMLWSFVLHLFICQLNNLADYISDRINPARRNEPLIAQRVSYSQAVRWVICAGSLLLVTSPYAFGTSRASIIAILLILIVSYGNIYQKKSRISPIYIDYLYGLCMALPAIIVMLSSNAALDPTHLLVACGLGLNFTVLNMFSGNLKDLIWDKAAGNRTTAISCGVTADPDSRFGVHFTLSYGSTVLLAQSLLMTALVSAFLLDGQERSAFWPGVLGGASCILAVISTLAILDDLLPRTIIFRTHRLQNACSKQLRLLRPPHAFTNLIAVCLSAVATTENIGMSFLILMLTVSSTYAFIAFTRVK